MMAEQAGIQLRLVFRDENLDLIDQYLTNGGRSIPKLLVIDNQTFKVEAEWGPRPAYIQNWFVEQKEKPGFDKSTSMENIHLWYAKNRQREIQNEIVAIMQQLDS